MSKLGHKHGGFLEGFHMFSPGPGQDSRRIVGEVFTVKFVPKEDTTSPKYQGNYVCTFHVCMKRVSAHFLMQVDTIPADSIIFISQPEPHINAVYGGLMSLRAQMLGAQGVIIDGRVRDIQEHRELGFPVCSPINSQWLQRY